ncbi:LLM class flavin-dependent oxidoreductase [Kribbella sp. NPDC048928]|uniref:LLM class flavin-dependent oxidoreductase n=1 Tax=Kribbella sp. NPDC048928 TaxID=3364111 RepID=UPI0037161D6F
MRLGVALDLGSTAAVRPQLDAAARLLEVAEGNGLSSAWIGESYHQRPEVFHLPGSLLVLSHLAGRTDLRLGTAVLLARAYHPRRLAYETALLDQLCRGRLSVGIALGAPELAERLGVAGPTSSAAAWFESFVDSLRTAWTDGSIAPSPVQASGPALLLGGRTPAAATRAARLGDGYYAATNYGDSLLAERAAGYWAARGERPGQVAVTRFCLIAPDTRTAREQAAAYFSPAIAYYTERQVWQGDALVGSPADVVAELRQYANAGVTAVQLRVAPYGTPPEVARRTLDLVGSEVLPSLVNEGAA